MTEKQRRRQWLYAILGLALGVIVVGFVFISVASFKILSSSHETIDAIRGQQKTNTSTNSTILDCTQPTGACFKAGQKRTAGAVASINRVVILASACAVGKTGTVAQIQTAVQACVIEGLARQNATR